MTASFLLLFATATAAAPAYSCSWEGLARNEDRGRIAIPLKDARQRIAALQGDGVDRASKETALQLLKRADTPVALGSITGRWKVRSLQFSDDPGAYDFGYAYSFFQARISDPPGCGLKFAKTTGSQRRAGDLYPISSDRRALAFLGGKTVNDEAQGKYDRRTANPANTAGRLIRLDQDELLMLLDYDNRGFELYHLKR